MKFIFLHNIALKSRNKLFRNFSSLLDSKLNDNINFYEEYGHAPVMAKEVIKALQPKKDQVFIDMTFGAGGHSRHLLNSAPIKLYCLDRDPFAYEKATKLAEDFEGSVVPLLGKFSELPSVCSAVGLKPNSVDGILIDAGCSSMQMDTAERGFSINKNGYLDMRMDGKRYPAQPTAADVLNSLDVPSLVRIFKTYGEEKQAKKVAQALFDARYMLKTINTTHELADIIKSTLGGGEQRHDMLHRPAHPATKIFQALRIFVNDELNELNYAMETSYTYLKPGGRLVALTFHSLEDRIVKRQILGVDLDEPVTHTLKQKYKNATACYSVDHINQVLTKKWKPLYKNVITPSAQEVDANPRSRSAKLRAAEKINVDKLSKNS